MRSFGVAGITIERIMEELSSNIDDDSQSHTKHGGYHNSEVLYAHLTYTRNYDKVKE